MATILRRVIGQLETIAPLQLADHSWDNVGLLIEAPNPSPSPIVFLTIDLTTKVLDEAIAKNASVIVSYHPPLFRAMKRITMSDPKQAIALRCAAHGISVYSPHTALDACDGGINDWLAKGLGAVKSDIVEPIEESEITLPGQDNAGAGRHVTFCGQQGQPLTSIIDRVKKHLNLSHLRVAMADVHKTKPIKTISICAGSGASLLSKGPAADLYLTGEMGHHEVLAALEQNTSVILCEHSNSERGYLKELQQKLQDALDGNTYYKEKLTVLVSEVDKDPLEIL